MSEEKGLDPVILDIAALSAAVAARCPSGTAEMIARLAERGVPDHQIRETVDLARMVAGESRERASGMIDAVLEGEPLESCMSRAMRGSGDCCGDTSAKSSCC